MNTSEKQTPEPTPELTSPEHRDVHEALSWIKTYGRSIGVGVLAAIVVVVGVSGFRAKKAQQEADALALLAGATTPEQWTAIRERYPKASAATLAALREGGFLAEQGRWDEALKTFEQFCKAQPDHFFRPSAELNIALCFESTQRPDEALKAYDAFAAARPGHYLLPVALLGRGRCLNRAGRIDEARATLEDFLAAYPKSSWTAQAEAALQGLRPEPPAPAPAGPAKADEL